MKKIYLNKEQFELLQEAIKEKLASERKEVNTSPTQSQCEAGNYKMGHISIYGFEISIENPKGSYRKGKDKKGREWKTLMHNDYGYFVKTKGKDGDAIDVFLGPYLDDKEIKIYPIDQFINGEFDETKVMFGFRDKESAKAAYLSNYEKDWKGFKYITEVDIETFKKWLYDGYRQRKPFAKYVSLTESINSIVKNNVEKKLRNKVKEMVKDGSLPTDSCQEMAEHYYNIISKSLDIDKKDVFDTIGKDDRYYFSIIDDEFEKCGGEYDTMDVPAHKKGIKKNLEKLHKVKLEETIKNSIKKTLNENLLIKNNIKEIEDISLKAVNEFKSIKQNIDKWQVNDFEDEISYSKELCNFLGFNIILVRDVSNFRHDGSFDGENIYIISQSDYDVTYKRILKTLSHELTHALDYKIGNGEAYGNNLIIDEDLPDCFKKIFYMLWIQTELNAYIAGDAVSNNWRTDYEYLKEQLRQCNEFNYGNEEDDEIWNIIREILPKKFQNATINAVKKYFFDTSYKLLKKFYNKSLRNTNHNCNESKNEEGNEIPKKCDKCNGEITLQIHGEPVYLCSKCGKYFGTMPFHKHNIDETMKKTNLPKNELAAMRKASRDEEIKNHGRATALRTTMEKNPKAYTRKEKHKTDLTELNENKKRIIRLTEEQFKNYCRTLLQEKRKVDFVKQQLNESYNQFTDDEGLSIYDNPNDIDEKYGTLDGYFTTNNAGRVYICDYNGEISFKGELENGKKYIIKGIEAKNLKDMILSKIEEGFDKQTSISIILSKYLKQQLNESKYHDENGDFYPPYDTIEGKFTVFQKNGEDFDYDNFIVEGQYECHIETVGDSNDTPGYSDVILDSIQFNDEISAELKEKIKSEIINQVENGHEGDLEIWI